MTKVRVEGLRELRLGLRRMDSGLARQIRLSGNEAAQIVVDTAKPRVPRLTGRAAGSIRVASTQTSVGVREGGSRVPYMAWLDFGGRVGRNRSVYRPFIKEGRYIWSAFRDERELVLSTYSDALANTARNAGLDVT